MSKHRRMSRRAKKFATVGATTATAAALTAGMVQPSSPDDIAVTWRDVLLASGNYTQLIEDWSNTYDNVLITSGNLGGAAANLWNPLASLFGGLLPTFTAGTEQNDLTTLTGILDALADALDGATDLSGVPGLPANAGTAILVGLAPGLVPALVVLPPVVVTVGSLAGLAAVLAVLDAVPLLDGVPDLGALIGLTATQTTFDYSHTWPILGLDGSTTFANTFVQLDGLSGPALITNILSTLNVAGAPISSVPGLTQLVNSVLAPLNAIATPSVTAWIPAGSGNYDLPLGGSFGWLASMPTLAIGPVPLLSETDTVVAIPLMATGAVLPLGLASFGTVFTPGVVFPTATGMSTLGGTSVHSFGIPLLGTSYSSASILQATYVGTNGFNYNSGTTIGALTTPFGTLPIVYSLGSYNAGTTGFGFTLPSLFTVGLLRPIQIGTAPDQQSPDGLIPADLLNLGLAPPAGVVPTQLIVLSDLLGLPSAQSGIDAFVNPVFNATAAPVGQQITGALNEISGPLTTGFSSGVEQLTGAIADATGALNPSQMMLSSASGPSGAKIGNTGPSTLGGADQFTNSSLQLNSTLKKANTDFATAAKNARAQSDAAVKRAQAQLNNIAADGQKAIKDTVDGVQNAVKNTVKKVSEAAKPAKETADS
jgi:gas vesicle protein